MVVGADDRRVAPRVAAAEPALLEHGDVGRAVLLGEVVGGREPVPAAADDDRVVARLRRGTAPGERPALVVAPRVARQREDRVFQRSPLPSAPASTGLCGCRSRTGSLILMAPRDARNEGAPSLSSDRARDAASGSPLHGTLMDLAEFLRTHGIDPARHEHPAVMTVEESKRLVPKLPGAKTKNLFLRDKKGRRHFLVTVPHDVAVDLDALAAALGVSGVGFASAERLQKYLGLKPGSVSLLGLVNDCGARGRIRPRPRVVGSGRRACASARQHGDDGRPARRSRALSRGDRPRAAGDRRARRGAALTPVP